MGSIPTIPALPLSLVSISFNDNMLSGTLPSSLGLLSQLRSAWFSKWCSPEPRLLLFLVVDVSRCGPVSHLHSLLDVSTNSLDGTVSTAVFALQSLQ